MNQDVVLPTVQDDPERIDLRSTGKNNRSMAELIFFFILFYLFCGVSFSVALLVKGLERMDPATANAGFGFRVIILPGLIVFWPFLMKKFLNTFKRSK